MKNVHSYLSLLIKLGQATNNVRYNNPLMIQGAKLFRQVAKSKQTV